MPNEHQVTIGGGIIVCQFGNLFGRQTLLNRPIENQFWIGAGVQNREGFTDLGKMCGRRATTYSHPLALGQCLFVGHLGFHCNAKSLEGGEGVFLIPNQFAQFLLQEMGNRGVHGNDASILVLGINLQPASVILDRKITTIDDEANVFGITSKQRLPVTTAFLAKDFFQGIQSPLPNCPTHIFLDIRQLDVEDVNH
jgi:hypothetical protein